MPIAIADIQSWSREEGHKVKQERGIAKLPVSEKESRFWLETIGPIAAATAEAASRTVVADSELDFFEFLAALKANGLGFVIRSVHDRRILDEQEGAAKLMEKIGRVKSIGDYQFELPDDYRRKRKRRTCKMEIKSFATSIRMPGSHTEALDVNLVEVLENEQGVPEDDSPVHWKLYTTHPVDTPERCIEVVKHYKERWMVEQLFRTTKKAGLKMESTQVHDVEAVKKLAFIAQEAACRILQCVAGRDADPKIHANTAFSEMEMEAMRIMESELEGKTQKQKNPHPPDSLPWAVWFVARLGGWKGYKSQAKPGPITMASGLKELNSFTRAMRILRGLDVYKE